MRHLCFSVLLAAASCASGTAAPRLEKASSSDSASYDKARTVLSQFVGRVQSGNFESAHGLLAAPLRARYTPARLREDFQKDPLARDRLDSLRSVETAPALLDDQGISFRLANGGIARLVREGNDFRISSLE